MKSTSVLAVGLLSAACAAASLPAVAQTAASNTTQNGIRTRAGIRANAQAADASDRGFSGLSGPMRMPQRAFPENGTLRFQSVPTGIALVTAMRGTTMSFRTRAGQTGFIMMSPRAVQSLRLRAGVAVFLINEGNGRVMVRDMTTQRHRVKK